MKPRLLDLFSGAGGAARGYQQAGFYVVGVDIKPQPRYAGDLFIQGDALSPPVRLEDFDVIHASPPCQAHSALRVLWRDRLHPDLIAGTRELLRESGRPYVIENVVGAPLLDPVPLCGSSIGALELRRHRLFECSFPMLVPPCAHGQQDSVVGVYGHTGAGANRGRERARGRENGVADWGRAMGIDWMTVNQLAQAIPPAYTRFIGEQLLEHLRVAVP